MAKASEIGRVGIALGGGAARGWAHIGVLKTMADHGVEPDVVCGSSIGALVGGVYACGQLAELEEWVRNLTRAQVLRLLDIKVLGSGAIAGRRLMELFRESFGDPAIETLPRRFAAVATDLYSGAEVWLQQGPLLDAVRASISIPGVFTPVLMNGRWLTDGSLVNPVPVNVCRALGADVVIAVDLNSNRMTRPRRPTTDPEPVVVRDHTWRVGLGNLLQGRHHGQQAQAEESGGGVDSSGAPEVDLEASSPSMRRVLAASLDIMQDRIGRARLAGDPPDLLLSPWLGEVEPLDFSEGGDTIEEGCRCVQRMLPALDYLLGLESGS